MIEIVAGASTQDNTIVIISKSNEIRNALILYEKYLEVMDLKNEVK